MINTVYSVTKFFQSETSFDDLIEKINTFCFENNIKMEGISHDQIEMSIPSKEPKTSTALGGTPIYIRSNVYTAIIFYSKRK